MTWVKIDDQFTFNPKVVAAGNEAAGAFVRMLAYCGAHLTDGELPLAMADVVAGPSGTLDRLVEAGLVELDDDVVRIPDFLDFNPSKEKVLDERKAAAERKARSRERSRSTSRRDSSATSREESEATSDRADGVRSASPSRPVPARTRKTKTTPQTPQRGARK